MTERLAPPSEQMQHNSYVDPGAVDPFNFNEYGGGNPVERVPQPGDPDYGILEHQNPDIDFNSMSNGNLITETHEVHELAVDLSRFGAVAVASEVQAGLITGTQTDAELLNPVTEKMTRARRLPSPGNIYKVVKTRNEKMVKASDTLGAVQGELQAMTESDTDAVDKLEEYIDGRMMHGFNDPRLLSRSSDMLLAGADLPVILRESVNEIAASRNIDPSNLGFMGLLQNASPQQRRNFGEWYGDRLNTLANPDTRAEFVDGLKDQYAVKVHDAMAEGWIDPRHAKGLDTSLGKADVVFFSPFGKATDTFGAAKQDRSRGALVALPTITGSHIVDHEFGHVFAGISAEGAQKYFTKTLGRKGFNDRVKDVMHLVTVVDEGWNEHMTVALNEGSPELISPTERKNAGIIAMEGESTVYKEYRELFSTLVGGEAGEIDRPEFKSVVDTMADRRLDSFAKIASNKWGGRDVLSEMLDVVTEHDARHKGKGSAGTIEGERELVTSLIDRLRNGKRQVPTSHETKTAA